MSTSFASPIYAPAFLLMVAAFLVPFLRGRLKSAVMLFAPVLALIVIMMVPEGANWIVSFLGHDLILGRVDRLSRVFGYIFSIVSFIGVIFALKVDDDLQHCAALTYAGSALGVTFAGDFFTLYVFWEVMALASTVLILARRTQASRAAGFRYILVHLFGGLCLLAGIIMYYHQTGTLEFAYIGLHGTAAWLIFIGIALNAALPPLHPWLQDAYPEATVTGAVFLSAFTTKSAVYLMARTFPGTELLIYLGAFMTAFPIFYAVLENDIRRVLAYSLINQVGFMMAGIGIGSALAINGAVSHAFCHILYKSLLFMSTGAVLHVTGRIRCTDLGGLYKTMPLTCLFCMIGAASISAFPLFSGFTSKSMIIGAAEKNHLVVVWLVLQFASAGVFHHAGIKVPFFTFFGHDSGLRAKEPPLNMLVAMGMSAFLCIFLGVYPAPLYHILPYPVEYVPYTASHVVGQLQLLMFGALAFCLLILSGVYPSEFRAINLDMDWFYRKGAGLFYRLADEGLNGINSLCSRIFAERMPAGLAQVSREGAARAILLFLVPAWLLSGFGAEAVAEKKKNLQVALRTGTLPIGIGAAAATIFLVLVFVLL